MSSASHIELSLVIPTFNEEGNVQRLYSELRLVLEQLQIVDYEVIFVDDGSSDASLLRIEELRAEAAAVSGSSLPSCSLAVGRPERGRS